MDSIAQTNAIFAILRIVPILSIALAAICSIAPANADDRLLSRPSDATDEILLVNTRPVGTACNGTLMGRRLQCEQYVVRDHGKSQWASIDWQKVISAPTAKLPTFVYIHGNRVARGEDRARGLRVYRSLQSRGKPGAPIRFVIWSWPSTTIPGPIKDYQVKARRTRPAAWQLAWFLDQLPEETSISLLGYSYGARIASGAMHLLGGGTLSGLKLDQRVHPQRPPIHVALVAAALDADWIQPGHYHGRAMTQVDKLVLVTNQLDPAMRFYHLSNGRSRMHALGKQGVAWPQTLGTTARRIKPVDVTREVGRSHSLWDYLAVSGKMTYVWRQLMPPSPSNASKDSSALAGHKSSPESVDTL